MINFLLPFSIALLIVLLPSDAYPETWQPGDSISGDSASTVMPAGTEPLLEDEEVHYRSEMVWHGEEIKLKGRVSFSENYDEVRSISPGGYLMVRERRWFTTRKLEVRGDENGNPAYHFTIRGRAMEFDERAQNWLREIMPELARRTGFNAAERVPRLLAEGGVDAVLREISVVESNSAKRRYFLILVETGNLSSADLERVILKAGEKISSSSQLNRLLSELSVKTPADTQLTAAFFRSAEEISSSSEKRSAIENIARSREMDIEAGITMGRSIRTISSSSEKARALETMAAVCPSDDAVIEAYLDAAISISSSSEKATALTALIHKEGLSPQSWIGITRAAETISSSSGQGRVLREMAALCPVSDEVVRAFLDSAFEISSSGEKEEALVALLQREGLSQSILAEILNRANSEISSSSSRQAVVEMVSQRLNVN
jgi:hypothetical protein